MLHYQPKKSKKSGFSLIELLVVVAIIGVLAAVAIPAYNNYRVNAAQASLTSSLNNIGKAFAACLTLKSFSNCDKISKIGVSCSQCDDSGGTGGQFCAEAETRVGGNNYNGCVQSSGGIHTVIGNWPMPCKDITIEYTCSSANNLVVPSTTCASLGCTATATVPANSDCGSASDKPTQACTTSDVDDLTTSAAFSGTCDDSTGLCS